MNNKFIIIFLSFFIFWFEGYSQKYLELTKASSLKSYIYFPGETIRFKLFNDKYFSRGTITGIGDSSLNFNDIKVPISKIEVVDIRSKTSNINKSLGLLIAGGSLAYFTIDFINLSLVQKANYKDVFNKNTLVNCIVGISVGSFIRIFAKKKFFKRSKLNRIWIQDIL